MKKILSDIGSLAPAKPPASARDPCVNTHARYLTAIQRAGDALSRQLSGPGDHLAKLRTRRAVDRLIWSAAFADDFIFLLGDI